MIKNRRGLKVLILVLCAGALVLFLTIKIINGFKDIQDSFSNDLPFTNSLPTEDSSIISKGYWNRIKVDKIINFKQRDPISVLLFDEKYYLIINKINLEKEKSLQTILHKTIEDVDRTTGEVYSILDLDNSYQFQYRSSAIKPVSQIFLTLSGDSLNSVWSDSIVSIHLIAADLSIRYADKSPIDIYVTGKELPLGFKIKRSVDLLVLKRGLQIYFLLMKPINSESKIAPELLYRIVTGH
jgi:hypothetical protein